MNRSYTYTAKSLLSIASIAFGTITLQSCGTVFDDLAPCPQGIEMRFVYDYNTEEANAFHTQVDCLTVHIYDDEGNFVSTLTPPTENLSDEDWRLRIDLPAGNYHAIAYGGIACDEASFRHVPQPAEGSRYTDISMQLIDSEIGKRLHDHFHGMADFTIVADSPEFTTVTMPMTKTTNHFRILLRQLNGQPVDGSDFEFYITDDNKELDYTNTPVGSGQNIIYSSNVRGSVEEVGYGEISTSRLHLSNSPHFIITSNAKGDGVSTRADGKIDPDKVIVDLPLLPYLLMTKSDASGWGNQEYLDRCSQWNMTFFLDENNLWSATRIIINGWTVRINDLDKY